MNKQTNKPFLLSSLSLASVAFLFAACDDGKSEFEENLTAAGSQIEETAEQTGDTLASWGEGLVDSLNDGWDEVKGATYDEREEVSDFFSNAKDSVEDSFDEMKESGGNMGDAAGDKIADLRNETREAWETVKEKSEALGDASEDSWEQTREEFANAWESFMDKMNELKAEVS